MYTYAEDATQASDDRVRTRGEIDREKYELKVLMERRKRMILQGRYQCFSARSLNRCRAHVPVFWSVKETGKDFLIDPVIVTVDRDLAELKRLGLSLAYSVDTHVHADHMTAARALKEKVGH